MSQTETESFSKLPFDLEGQMSVLGWMLKNREFCFKCKTHLSEDIFVDNVLGEIFTTICQFVNDYNDIPSVQNLITVFSYKQNAEFIKIKQTINDCVALTANYNLPFLQKGITVWLQTAVFRNYTISVAKHYKKANIPVLSSMMKTALEKINEINFMKGLNYEFGDDPLTDLTQAAQSKIDVITSGCPEFDAALGGGFYKGEHTVLLAPTNVGKTSICLNFLYHNIMQKKYCMFIVHEGVPLQLMNKLRQRFLELTDAELVNIANTKDPEHVEALKRVQELFKEYLVFKPILKSGGLYIEDVVTEIKIEQERLFARTGKYFDLVIDDYPAKLQSRVFNNRSDKRSILQYVYEEFHRIAMEYSCHAISPVQINREGYKSNKEREPGTYLGVDNISEAFGIAQDADNAMTANRSDLDDKNEILYINLDKTRRSKHKQILQFTTDYSRAITHDPRLGCTVLTAGHKNTTLKAINSAAKILNDD